MKAKHLLLIAAAGMFARCTPAQEKDYSVVQEKHGWLQVVKQSENFKNNLRDTAYYIDSKGATSLDMVVVTQEADGDISVRPVHWSKEKMPQLSAGNSLAL
jgi:hypothetical protein